MRFPAKLLPQTQLRHTACDIPPVPPIILPNRLERDEFVQQTDRALSRGAARQKHNISSFPQITLIAYRPSQSPALQSASSIPRRFEHLVEILRATLEGFSPKFFFRRSVTLRQWESNLELLSLKQKKKTKKMFWLFWKSILIILRAS